MVDAAGSVLRRVSVTVGGLLDGSSGKEGLLGWLLASGAIGSAVDNAREKYFPPAAEGEDDSTGTGDGTGEDQGPPQEEPPPADDRRGLPVTGEPSSDEEPPSDDDPTGSPPESPTNEGPAGVPPDGTPLRVLLMMTLLVLLQRVLLQVKNSLQKTLLVEAVMVE